MDPRGANVVASKRPRSSGGDGLRCHASAAPEDAVHPIGSTTSGPPNGVKAKQHPQRDSNPCRRLERALPRIDPGTIVTLDFSYFGWVTSVSVGEP